ncbi:hypothetical protein D6850_18165 [Roseovarius spongiae]|uniref:Uncharacterized protein n=1 Tax=Roseovarius spongiae TaxID=2320272 RepID=A0A3A8APZ2_9RHOB|nr:hypothetical protein [Roseovarius spongiae]RKF12397.1 hypothetical protein D6850_18165 [Roseovarius spongiae]
MRREGKAFFTPRRRGEKLEDALFSAPAFFRADQKDPMFCAGARRAPHRHRQAMSTLSKKGDIMSDFLNGSCGLAPSEIISLADRLGKIIATFGASDPESMNDFCMYLGEALTGNYARRGLLRDHLSYEQRVSRVLHEAIDTLGAAFWRGCADLGPYEGPAPEKAHLRVGVIALLKTFEARRRRLDVSGSEILDLLAWVQMILATPHLFEQRPEMADLLLSRERA